MDSNVLSMAKNIPSKLLPKILGLMAGLCKALGLSVLVSLSLSKILFTIMIQFDDLLLSHGIQSRVDHPIDRVSADFPGICLSNHRIPRLCRCHLIFYILVSTVVDSGSAVGFLSAELTVFNALTGASDVFLLCGPASEKLHSEAMVSASYLIRDRS